MLCRTPRVLTRDCPKFGQKNREPRSTGSAAYWKKYGAIFLHEGGYEAQYGPTSIPKFATGHSAHFDKSDYKDGKSILKQYILDCGGKIRFSTKFVKFEHDGHKVTAAIAQDTTTKKYIRFVGTKGIVLATGGYQNNEDMMNALQPDTRPCMAFRWTAKLPVTASRHVSGWARLWTMSTVPCYLTAWALRQRRHRPTLRR